MKKIRFVALITVIMLVCFLPHVRAENETAESIKVGNIVTFGHYEQDNNLINGTEPIEWSVLEIDVINNRALLISRYALDARPYNRRDADVTWETCSLRNWLNQDFYNAAFSNAEQEMILITDVDNSENQGYSAWSTDGGNNTEDKVFLLSYAEALRYYDVTWENLQNMRSRVAPTEFAIHNYAWTLDDRTSDGMLSGFWWRRSPGGKQNYAAGVNTDGSLCYPTVFNGCATVRPVIWVNLGFNTYTPDEPIAAVDEHMHDENRVDWHRADGEVYNSLGEHFSFEIENNRAVLIAYWVETRSKQPIYVQIPEIIDGVPVTAIGQNAFNNLDGSYDGAMVDCIKIPEGVTELREGSFECAHGIKRIELPSTLTEISSDYPFHHVEADISFPNDNPYYKMKDGFLIDTRTDTLIYCCPTAYQFSLPRVRKIGNSALENYSPYQVVLEFPSSVEYIGSLNAYDCVGLEIIIVPESVVEIADHALSINTASEIILHEGLRKIGAYAFEQTEITSINIPSTVEWIGANAFFLTEVEEQISDLTCYIESEAEYRQRTLTGDDSE